MAAKIYAVKVGRQPGLYRTWSECDAQVGGFTGAVYKGFKSEAEALVWLGRSLLDSSEQVDEATPTPDEAARTAIYTDGAARDGRYAWAYVIIKDEVVLHEASGLGTSAVAADAANVAGELSAVMRAVTYARKQGLLPATIYHDMEGISRWVLGDWKARTPVTEQYVQYMQDFKQELQFVHVRAHTGIQWNEQCDRLAKAALEAADKTQGR